MIRNPSDRGVVVLLDDRFAHSEYKKYYPRDLEFKVSSTPLENLQEFFRE
jgi:Rad3-related DNA helicase